MTTDKELLELSVKAAGIEIEPCTCSNKRWPFKIKNDFGIDHWNPLASDGDALRLAEQCSLTVCMDGIWTVSACDECRKDEIFVTQSIHECGGSRITATRRAIVRAAAEIGKAANE